MLISTGKQLNLKAMGRGQIAEDKLSLNFLERDTDTPKRDLTVQKIKIDELEALDQDVLLSRGLE